LKLPFTFSAVDSISVDCIWIVAHTVPPVISAYKSTVSLDFTANAGAKETTASPSLVNVDLQEILTPSFSNHTFVPDGIAESPTFFKDTAFTLTVSEAANLTEANLIVHA
jgi:hypothetical protein